MTDYPESDAPVMEQERSDEAETTLLPKSMFADAKVGDVIRVKVIASLEDELEVEKSGSDDKQEAKKNPDAGLDAEMDAFMAANP